MLPLDASSFLVWCRARGFSVPMRVPRRDRLFLVARLSRLGSLWVFAVSRRRGSAWHGVYAMLADLPIGGVMLSRAMRCGV